MLMTLVLQTCWWRSFLSMYQVFVAANWLSCCSVAKKRWHFHLVKTWWNDVLFKGDIEVHLGKAGHRGYRQSFLKYLFKIKRKIAAKMKRARSQSINGKGKFNNLLLGGGGGGGRRKGRGVTCPWLRDCSSFFFFDRKLTFLSYGLLKQKSIQF